MAQHILPGTPGIIDLPPAFTLKYHRDRSACPPGGGMVRATAFAVWRKILAKHTAAKGRVSAFDHKFS